MARSPGGRIASRLPSAGTSDIIATSLSAPGLYPRGERVAHDKATPQRKVSDPTLAGSWERPPHFQSLPGPSRISRSGAAALPLAPPRRRQRFQLLGLGDCLESQRSTLAIQLLRGFRGEPQPTGPREGTEQGVGNRKPAGIHHAFPCRPLADSGDPRESPGQCSSPFTPAP